MRVRTDRGRRAARERAIYHLIRAAECYRDAGDDRNARQIDALAYQQKQTDGWGVVDDGDPIVPPRLASTGAPTTRNHDNE